jgi:hypothetical protein
MTFRGKYKKAAQQHVLYSVIMERKEEKEG